MRPKRIHQSISVAPHVSCPTGMAPQWKSPGSKKGVAQIWAENGQIWLRPAVQLGSLSVLSSSFSLLSDEDFSQTGLSSSLAAFAVPNM